MTSPAVSTGLCSSDVKDQGAVFWHSIDFERSCEVDVAGEGITHKMLRLRRLAMLLSMVGRQITIDK